MNLRFVGKALTLLLVSLATVEAGEVRHLELSGSHLIDTADDHYAIATPGFSQVNWKTVTVNVKNVFIMSPKCEMIFKQIDKLSDAEGTLLNTTRNLIASLETDRPRVSAGQKDYSGSHFGDESVRLVSGSNRMTNFESKGYFISKFDNNNFTARKASFPNQWARIFVTPETVTFIYRNGGLLMKPGSCLMKNEKQVVDEMRAAVRQGDPSKSAPRGDNRRRRARATQAKGLRATIREKFHSFIESASSLISIKKATSS